MRRAVLAALVALTGCFTASVRRPAPFVAWPDLPRAKPLAVGQWALYRERDGDDIGYAQKDQAETSVLFELIARRYETRSLAVASNQPFSAWDRIFPDQAVTVAAIDRLVHHATILEMNVDSYRRRAAAGRSAAKADASATTTGDNLADNHHYADSDNLGDNIG